VSFDRVAPHYRWLETLIFGNQLQQARVAFVREIEAPLRILIIGEGNGRFLTELMRTSEARVDCVEMSARMIALARKQVPDAHVNFIQADIRDLTLCQAHYDLIVSHFFFDCFTERALAEIIARLANAAAPDARWLVADFCYPTRGWHHQQARVLIATMYFFFRAATGIEARRLVDYNPLLRGNGFRLKKELLFRRGEIRSQLWRRVVPRFAQDDAAPTDCGASRSE
jgi:ubiquinone/menaquinone biosynthesis C-methylase UbiE